MMPAAKHFDPVVGVDIHLIQPPGPVPPLPVPHPYIGIVIDYFDYAPIIGATIKVNGLCRAIAGTAGKAIPSHIPIGGVFVPPPPANEHEDFMGSATVEFDGDAATYMSLPCLSCQSVGMLPIPRLNPKKGTKLTTFVAPTSVVLPIPAGPPVLIGGPPTISLMVMAFHLIGPLLKVLGKTKVGKAVGKLVAKGKEAAGKVWRKAFSWMPEGFIKCKILKAEPVDIRTGEVIVHQQDFELPGRIPIRWSRRYGSNSSRVGVCGRGWETPADARLELQPDGSVIFVDGEGVGALFGALPHDGPVREPVDGWVLDRTDTHYSVNKKRGLSYYFPIPGATWQELLVDAVVDQCRNSLHFVRGAEGLQQVVESAGRRLQVVSRAGLVEQMILHHPDFAEPRTLVRFTYDREGRLTTVYDALGQPYTFGYWSEGHGRGRISHHTNRIGLSFYYEYDEAGHCVHSWGDGGLYDYHFEYDPAGRWTNYVDSLGHSWSAELDERGQIVREIDPLGGITSYTYDEVGRTVSVVDADSHRTDYQYDERGNLVKLGRADGTAVRVDYDDADKAICVIDANGARWEQSYDANGLLAGQVSPLGAACQYVYDAGGRPASFTDTDGARTVLSFDRYGNLTHLTDAAGSTASFRHDALGNLRQREGPGGQVTEYEFDAKGRLTKASLPGGSVVAFAYDQADHVVEQVDANGRSTRLDYCAISKLRRRLRPDGSSVEYIHDTEERLVGIRNERGELHRFVRDPLGRIVEEIDYWGESRRYAHTPGGGLVETLDPLGNRARFETDPLGRVLKKTLHGADEARSVETAIFAYDGNGNLTACENGAIRIERSFDPHGRLIQERQGNDCIVTYTVDPKGDRLERSVELTVDGLRRADTVTYRHDRGLRQTQVDVQGCPPIRLQHDIRGRLTEQNVGSQLRRRFAYGADDFLTAQQVLVAGSAVLEQSYAYDRSGNLLERADSVQGETRYGFDLSGRLVSQRDGRGVVELSPCDEAGDRLITRPLPEDGRETGKGAGLRGGSYRDTAYIFDAAGSLIERSAPGRSCKLVWDGNQRLVSSSTDGQPTTYHYDALGRRVRKETEGGVTRFFWGGDAVIAELRSGAAARGPTRPRLREWVYFPGSFEPLAMRETRSDSTEDKPDGPAADLFVYHNEPNGCPSRLFDASGSVVWAARYGGWGEISSLAVDRVDNPLRLQGQYHDGETGLYYNRHRYYDPTIGAFSSRDPLGQLAGVNLYSYAPNIFKWIDPLGLNCTVFRVDNPHTGDRVVIDASGNVTIPDKAATLHVSFGTDTHAQYFAEPGSTIKSFEVPDSVADDLRARAVPQRDAGKVHKQQIKDAPPGTFVNPPPQIDDPHVSKKLGRDERDCLGVTGSDIDILEKNAVPGSGKVVPTAPRP